jgi:DNA invertase Pin-like site-specific DNA recombinase
MYYVASAFAEMERDILIERTQAGLLAARARGRKGGRPKALTPKKAQMVKDLYRNKENWVFWKSCGYIWTILERRQHAG